ncbi:hypothetical protein [Amycolatopsis speibonae]|uniref:Uncharacterized protein n=1 Tax=Amycolatopsis speibonae TaxID=1450224 RepID=A0ABV7P6N5_9PSEU
MNSRMQRDLSRRGRVPVITDKDTLAIGFTATVLVMLRLAEITLACTRTAGRCSRTGGSTGSRLFLVASATSAISLGAWSAVRCDSATRLLAGSAVR